MSIRNRQGPAGPGSLIFVFGSGISLRAGLPSVGDLTESVLREAVFRHTDATYGPRGLPRTRPDEASARSQQGRAYVEAAYDVIAIANDLAHESYEGRGLPVTYEDVFEVVRGLSTAINSYAPSPASAPLIAEVERRWSSTDLELHAALPEALACMSGIINAKLSVVVPDGNLHYLGAIVDACDDHDPVDYFTLNHDLLVESRLEAREITFRDGFAESVGLDLRFWDDTFDDAHVRLYKLHGSIDWYLYNRPDAPGRADGMARCANNPRYPRDHHGNTIADVFPAFDPAFLTGLEAKMRGYQAHPFAELFGHLHARLRCSRRVVATGYGFRDRAVHSDSWHGSGTMRTAASS